jgi:hypothetical protein
VVIVFIVDAKTSGTVFFWRCLPCFHWVLVSVGFLLEVATDPFWEFFDKTIQMRLAKISLKQQHRKEAVAAVICFHRHVATTNNQNN